MNFLFMLLFLPTLCKASFFDNYTNLVSYTYSRENCGEKPLYYNVSDTMSCVPYQNISLCCESIMKQNNFTGPLNICYNKNGGSTFSSCYEQRLTPIESNTIGFLTIMGVILIACLCGAFMYTTFICMFSKRNRYDSINN
jgi:hypothetical protein